MDGAGPGPHSPVVPKTARFRVLDLGTGTGGPEDESGICFSLHVRGSLGGAKPRSVTVYRTNSCLVLPSLCFEADRHVACGRGQRWEGLTELGSDKTLKRGRTV